MDKISFLQLDVRDIDFKPQLDSLPVLLCGLDTVADALKAKEYLVRFFPPDTAVYYYEGEARRLILDNLDVCHGENSSALILPDTGFDKTVYTFGDLIRLTQRLTGEGGCPWDKEQTHASIRSNMIEEAYEAAYAIDCGNRANLIEELGDVLLQSIFHADIARRSGEFEISDILSVLCRKLYTRHTHIFGGKEARDGEEAFKNWQEAKEREKEKAGKGANEGKGTQARIKDCAGLPSLMRAQKIYKKLAEDKAKATETEEKTVKTDKNTDIGKLLYDSAVLCSNAGIDAETELNAYLNKIINDINRQS